MIIKNIPAIAVTAWLKYMPRSGSMDVEDFYLFKQPNPFLEFIDYSVSLIELSYQCGKKLPEIYRSHRVELVANCWQGRVSHRSLLRIPLITSKADQTRFYDPNPQVLPSTPSQVLIPFLDRTVWREHISRTCHTVRPYNRAMMKNARLELKVYQIRLNNRSFYFHALE